MFCWEIGIMPRTLVFHARHESLGDCVVVKGPPAGRIALLAVVSGTGRRQRPRRTNQHRETPRWPHFLEGCTTARPTYYMSQLASN
ncbi:hypothetical protein GUJ93_ZPchr0006g46183 [Zizania palustris]|uniref:Uncharacterized protein n=1 Tax=Zizania palustris TaxID=103762 RepID=A0A8J5T0V4_ZIZPA|nr:hypothetical protein GUJ93_ZPchr0006g46183 [Zizania palustris]